MYSLIFFFIIIGDVQEATDQFMEAVEERIKFVVRKLREYVNDAKMEQILMKPIEVIYFTSLYMVNHFLLISIFIYYRQVLLSNTNHS